MTFAHLSPQALAEVRDAAIAAGFADDEQLKVLTSTMSPGFVAVAVQGGNRLARLISLLNRMNATRALASGEVPMWEWLNQAIPLAGGLPEEMVFRRALEIVSPDGAARPGTVPTDVPGQVSGGVAALPATDGDLEVVIGKDDTLAVDFLHVGVEVARSVAKVVVHRYFDGKPSTVAGGAPEVGDGTAWMIGPGLLITNHHVVNARIGLDTKIASDVDFALQGRTAKAVFDFYRLDSATHETSSVECVAADRELDYAILRLAPDPPPRPPLRLRPGPLLKPPDRELEERVNVLQHPGGNPMRLGFRNNYVVTGTADHLSYLTDTSGGSSGSPICDDAWSVVALHRGWQVIPGGPLTVRGQQVKQENYGTPIGRILDHLAANHPALHAEVLAGQS
ncbi:serine protease [Saccharothrix sp. S26]|uniref:trypsin-like peptidase domain-containing protein n=1 Tax=Saccharothrix sp. S26 TaxID=2907215 RepID=UPI001F354A9E|nr:trypsin-like peptidase domain-containing protein [Saccharothrix sp. S26]MCE6996316.1 serine protease [Saccharothrix sp. S26]